MLERIKLAINGSKAAPGMPVKLVAIDGYGGAGKTERQIRDDWDRWHSYEKEYVKRDHPDAFANIIVNGTK